ncbi:ornithine cyclodeaminase family protein [Sulfitobacter sp.]|uniref:ornithine cyclodeaminase family protein n=1 Tax=Sulfitobacter sp. TaxID=1903071 RepID=UPI0030029368
MLDLNKPQIIALFDFDTAVNRINDAYIASTQGNVQTGDVVHLAFPEANGDCHVKSGHISGTTSYVIKIASGFYDNPAKGLPSSNGMMLAFCATTGEPLAVLRDEGWLTDMRTAIGGALATRALARKNAKQVLIIGAGIQARFQAICLAKLMPERALAFSIWARDPSAAQAMSAELKGTGHVVETVLDLEAAVSNADIIITTTTATEPLFANGLVRTGTHITAIGADCPGKQELPTDLVTTASLRVCDMARQSLNHGEFQTASRTDAALQVIELGEVLSGAHAGRTSDNDITVVDLTGIAAQDIAITQTIIDAAASTDPT